MVINSIYITTFNGLQINHLIKLYL